tara:strand:+ start:1521 stop:2438 length:918 start_codon:yes stop_codon:yes gene_type:complete
MAIIEIITGGSPMDLSAMAIREDFDVLEESTPSLSTGFEGCPDLLKVFADDSGNYLQNDKTSFLAFTIINDIQFILQKDCEDIQTITDSSLGDFYPKGFWSMANGFSKSQSRYSGLILDWSLVLSTYGVGSYRLVVNNLSGGDVVSSDCGCDFLLQEYSREKADKTIRIRTLQNGDIMDSFNYLGLNWEQSWRIDGFFGYPQDKLETDNYLDANRNLSQIQDTLFKEYTLQTDFLANCYKSIFDDILISNEIFIDDYNIKNAYNLKNVDVIPSESTSEYFIESIETFKEITFEDRERRKIKRNVK